MPAGTAIPATRRVRLALAAAAAVAAQPGVEPAAGARWSTPGPDGPIPGVLAVEGTGGVDLQLHVDVDWPPPAFDELATLLRFAVRDAAGPELGAALGDVDVAIRDVVLPGARP